MERIRYVKPNMNNLPYELGKEIFETIMNTKPVDREKIHKEVAEFKKKALEARERGEW